MPYTVNLSLIAKVSNWVGLIYFEIRPEVCKIFETAKLLSFRLAKYVYAFFDSRSDHNSGIKNGIRVVKKKEYLLFIKVLWKFG